MVPSAESPGPGQTSSSSRPTARWQTTALVLLLLLGTFMLLYKFPSVPLGLHQDEMSEAYEAYSLLHTGADRWGYHLPIYFLSWGSGQNVLPAYLTIPIVATLGLTRVSARLLSLLCGLLTLPLFFFVLRRWFNDNVALLGLLFLALSPWHIMISRIGIENSPIPFFLLLGVYTFGKALDSRSPWLILPCFLPFAAALYTYGVVIVVIPVLVPLLLFMDPLAVWKSLRLWLGALAVLFVASLPIVFFAFKNYITKKNYAFEHWLPFSVPLCHETRLGEAKAHLGESVPWHNIHFILGRFTDEIVPLNFFPWFQVPGHRPVPTVLLLLAAFAIVLLAIKAVRQRRFTEPFLPCILACAALIPTIPLNISRDISVFLPLLALAAVGCWEFLCLIPKIQKDAYRIATAAILAAFFLVPTISWARAYYTSVYAAEATKTFNPLLPQALQASLQLAGPVTPIYLTPDISLNYVQVLFLTKTDPRTFQNSGATTEDADFGQYVFSRQTLPHTPFPFVFLLKQEDILHWTTHHAVTLRQHPEQPADQALYQRWIDTLPPTDAARLTQRLHHIEAAPLPEVIQIGKTDLEYYPDPDDFSPICTTPTQVTSIGQFLIGRCPS